MQNRKTSDEICAKLNELSHGQPPQDAWPAANWSYDAASNSYRSNAVTPGSLMEALENKLQCDDSELYAVPMAPAAGSQVVLSAHLAGVIAANRESQLLFQSALFDYSPAGTAAYLKSVLGGHWSYNAHSDNYEGEFMPNPRVADPTGIQAILREHEINTSAAYIVRIPDAEITELRGNPELVGALHANMQRNRCDGWAGLVTGNSAAKPAAATVRG